MKCIYVIIMYTMAVCLSITKIYLTVSELDHEFHRHSPISWEKDILQSNIFVPYTLHIRNKSSDVIPSTSQGEDTSMIDCVTMFPSGMHYSQYKGLFVSSYKISCNPLWDDLCFCHILAWLSKCINLTNPTLRWNTVVKASLKLTYSC